MSSDEGLNGIYFTDLLLGETEALYKVGNGEFKPVPADAMDDVQAIFNLCRDIKEKDSRVHYKDVTYRCSRMITVGGVRFALRRPMAKPISLDALGFDPLLIKRLRSKEPVPYGIPDGLIIFTGLTCSGKTTSAGALIAERLTEYGGLAMTIEDPPELDLQRNYGPGGHGRCYQCDDIAQMGGVAETGRAILRFASPNIVLYGEIRDGKAAAEAIRAALSGHFVIITTHSAGIAEAVERLVFYASEETGAAATMHLATALSCIIHQRLEGGTGKLQLYADFLFATDSVKAKIRERQYHTLDNDIEQQRTNLLLSKMPRPKDIIQPQIRQKHKPSFWRKLTGRD